MPFAVNPWNFVVQPLNYQEQLKQLMEQLQEHCATKSLTDHVNMEDVVVGRIYASKHDDGLW